MTPTVYRPFVKNSKKMFMPNFFCSVDFSIFILSIENQMDIFIPLEWKIPWKVEKSLTINLVVQGIFLKWCSIFNFEKINRSSIIGGTKTTPWCKKFLIPFHGGLEQ